MSNLKINGEVFIPIDDARDYLVDERAVYELGTLYFHYKGFADFYQNLNEPTGSCLDEAIFYADPERVHINGMMCLFPHDVEQFWHAPHDGADFYSRNYTLHIGEVNGENIFIDPISYFDLGGYVFINESNVYARQSDMDALSERFGIAKHTCTTEINDEFDDTYSEDESLEFDGEVIDSGIRNFLDSIIVSHPKATSKDIISHCFEHHKGNRIRNKAKKIMEKLGINMDKTGGGPLPKI